MFSFAHQDVRLPSLAAIQAFESAARLGSFGRAAEELCVTSSAVGKRIAQLEDILGRELFERSNRGVHLNASGREYLEQIQTALHLLSDISMHKRSIKQRERLRVVSTPTFAHEVLVPHLGEFSEAHPHVDLELLLSIPYLDIGPAQADFWIRFGQGRYPGVSSEPLTSDPIFPVCSPAYLNSIGPLDGPHDLQRARLLRCPLDPWKPWFDAAGLDWPEPEEGVRFVDIGMALGAARAGQGVAIGRRSLASSWLAEGCLVAPFEIEAIPEAHYYLCHEASMIQGEAMLSFSLWLKGVCQKVSRIS